MIEIDTTVAVCKPPAPPFQFGLGGLMLGSTAVAIFFATWIWSREWAVLGLSSFIFLVCCIQAARTPRWYYIVAVVAAANVAGLTALHCCAETESRHRMELSVKVIVCDRVTLQPIHAARIQIARGWRRSESVVNGFTDLEGCSTTTDWYWISRRKSWLGDADTFYSDEPYLVASALGYETFKAHLALLLPRSWSRNRYEIPIYLNPQPDPIAIPAHTSRE